MNKQVIGKIRKHMDLMLDQVTSSARSVIVAGSPGVGKTYNIMERLENSERPYTKASGHSSPLWLYKHLYLNRHEGNILVLDDIDSVMNNNIALNLLKAAMDTLDERVIEWGSNTKLLGELPTDFIFKGKIVWVTNFDDRAVTRQSEKNDHLNAVFSRSTPYRMFYKIDEVRDWCLNVAVNHQLPKAFDKQADRDKMFTFYCENFARFRRQDLRTLHHLIQLYKDHGEKYEDHAEVTLMDDV